jgi:hypothetical protein
MCEDITAHVGGGSALYWYYVYSSNIVLSNNVLSNNILFNNVLYIDVSSNNV